ncbi:MAG: subclass B3 metallo-beta-lactamase [Acidobacteria bacterium]|nr:subclass B3 metallo-beta-lactamase [Acidobacteriota bacterium]
MNKPLALALLGLALTPSAPATPQETEAWRAMNQPVEPFEIGGGLYYVGASSVTSYLLTSEAGHILIDGGFEETAPMILANVASLGFDITDVRVLLNSHAHTDHVGGLAELKRASGAEIWISRADAEVAQAGGRGDPVLGDRAPFPPVAIDRQLRDGDSVTVGPWELTALVTAGHTPGCTSWAFDVELDGARQRAVSICSVSVLDGVQLVGEETYPGIRSDFERTFRVLREQNADVFLASHAGFFRMTEKRAALAAGASTNPFIDPAGYLAFVERTRLAFQEILEAQQAAGDAGQ